MVGSHKEIGRAFSGREGYAQSVEFGGWDKENSRKKDLEVVQSFKSNLMLFQIRASLVSLIKGRGRQTLPDPRASPPKRGGEPCVQYNSEVVCPDDELIEWPLKEWMLGAFLFPQPKGCGFWAVERQAFPLTSLC
ncbi:hypothetical protein ACH5RR_031981 [Cinchona calisaya]|uniref:Uncharacterized protein n=1 Tax=Cinchona calisaya TaxID=153742 RepID=A0ABD2YJG9_9GENT